jgi:hypothetical protein
VASLTPLDITECAEAIAIVGATLAAEPALERSDLLKLLRSLHESLMRATRAVAEAPRGELHAAADAVASVEPQIVDALAPRPRTVYRLLRSGALDAAWEVLGDNGTGVVDEGYAASTATGAARTSPRLPLLTRIEAGTVYAELPGFRDPRYAAPDDCYDITSTVGLKCQVDELSADGGRLTIAGWAALDVLTATADERVAVVLTAGDRALAWPARRRRRADLVSGRGDALTRRAWAGFSAVINLDAAGISAGEWALWVEVEHEGIVVCQRLGRDATELAIAATRASIRIGSMTIRWDTSEKHWTLVVS